MDGLSCGQTYHENTNHKNLWASIKYKQDSGKVKYVHVGFVRLLNQM